MTQLNKLEYFLRFWIQGEINVQYQTDLMTWVRVKALEAKLKKAKPYDFIEMPMYKKCGSHISYSRHCIQTYRIMEKDDDARLAKLL